MPGSPDQEKALAETACGRQDVVSFNVFLNRDLRFANRGFYYVTYADAKGGCKDRDLGWLLDQERNIVVKGLGARLVEERETAHPYPGREIKMLDSRGDPIRARIYFISGRVYHVGVGGRREAESQDGQGFLESFRVLSGQDRPAAYP
jgi:hypothetical protein